MKLGFAIPLFIAVFAATISLASAQQTRGTLVISMGAKGGVEMTPSTTASVLDIDKNVGEEVCFTLTAKDKNGNVIRSWNTSGNPTTVKLLGSTANTDTSTRSWNAEPMSYTWASITHNGNNLTQVLPNEWSIPATEFDSAGQCRICLTDTKAERGVQIEINPTVAYLNQLTEKINFIEGGTTNYLVEITSQAVGKSAVFHERPYEILVTPRDKFLNPTKETMQTRFTARWPGEFDKNDPGLADIFAGEWFITGPTNYIIASRIVRESPADLPQYIMAYKFDDPKINGRSDDYDVMKHAPNPFVLQTPPDESRFDLSSGLSKRLDFTWERPVPVDPYTDIQTSRFDPRKYSDNVSYTWVMVDSISLTRAEKIQSNNSGVENKLTLTYNQCLDLMQKISGQKSTASYTMYWFVEATDGLYTTLSSPPSNDPSKRPGYRITFDYFTAVQPVAAPVKLGLSQNYPNPFNPSTTIRYSVPTNGRVTLRVFDLLGTPVRTVVDEFKEAGEYSVSFGGNALPSGTYIYKLQFDGKTITRQMTMMK